MQHNQASNQTKRGGGYLPRGGMALPSNMLTFQKGEICYMGKILGCEIVKTFICGAEKVNADGTI